MIKLSDDEKRLLQGEEGTIAQLCTTVSCGDGRGLPGRKSWWTLTEREISTHPRRRLFHITNFPLEELRELAESGARFKIPTFANKSPFGELTPVQGWEHCNMCSHGQGCHNDPAFHKAAMHEEYYELYRKMGMMLTHSCASYMTATYLPTFGQHCSWNESSAVPYCNAVLGALGPTSMAALQRVISAKRRTMTCI